MKIKLHSLFLIAAIVISSCSKQNTNPGAECETWVTTYWQGKADKTTVTHNYTPYTKDMEVCGAGKDTVYKNKTIVISTTSDGLYNYKTFTSKK